MTVTHFVYVVYKNRSILTCSGYTRIICTKNATDVLQSAVTLLETLP